jgi:Protein of unknown function (DUF2800)
MDDIRASLAALKQVYGGEALFRPSSISRLIACPGSVRLIAMALQAGWKKWDSPYAKEGSAAHVVAEQALKGIRQPDEWTDRMVQLDKGGLHGHFVDAEMVEKVSEYVDEVRSNVEDGCELLVEQYMSLSALDPDDPIVAENRGTADAVILNRAARRVKVRDLKYGRGVPVSGDAPQLRNYAILVLLNHPLEGGWREIEIGVNQPRLFNESDRFKSFTFDPNDLMIDFLGELMQAMHASLDADPSLKTGAHCRWCPAKDANICPAVRQEAVSIGRDAFEHTPMARAASGMGPIPEVVFIGTAEEPRPAVADPVPGRTVVLPSAALASPDEVATVLERRMIYDVWIESYERRAAQLIGAGVTVPGWILSARAGNRRWKGDDEKATQDALMAIGLKSIEMYSVPKLLSPAQVEKKLKKADRGLIEPLVERPKGQPTLMRAGADREPSGKGMGAIEQD